MSVGTSIVFPFLYLEKERAQRDTNLSSIQRPYSSGNAGSAFAIEPATTSMGGKTAFNPRAINGVAVPRLPDKAIPPIPRSIAPKQRAVLIAFYNTIGIPRYLSMKDSLINHY